jgi:hypothetical protein
MMEPMGPLLESRKLRTLLLEDLLKLQPGCREGTRDESGPNSLAFSDEARCHPRQTYGENLVPFVDGNVAV